jgi:hypothetical protein
MTDRPVRAIEEEILVEYGVFALQAYPSPQVALALGRPDGLLLAGPGGAVFASATTDHYAHVRVELWPHRPAPPRPATRAGSAELTTDAPGLRLASVTAAIGEQLLELPAAGRYAVRAGVTELGPRPDDLDEDPTADLPGGVEDWLIQLWPL